ncbi:MAG: amino acid permease, partial [Ignavibacteriales bacterium]|nr:amino acid permease [Ignavibacteriales bacterium]
LREGMAIHVGMIIGSGIFIVPAAIAGHLHSLGPILLAWLLGGLLVLFGALTLAELSSILPQAGGPYIYLRESYGRIWGFLYTWNHFLIQAAGTLAALSVAFATYLGYFFPALSPQNSLLRYSWSFLGYAHEFSLGWTQIIAMGTIALLTLINVRGVKMSGWVMTVFTSFKVLVVLGLVVAVFTSGKGSSLNFLPWWPDQWTGELTSAFGLAMISVLWTYDGWSVVTLAAGEIRDPERNVPLSLLFGTLLVIMLYLLVNLAYAYVIPIEAMVGSPRVAADAALIVLGPVGASLVTAGILCSTFGTINGSLLSNPRSIYAAGDDRTFPEVFGKVHPRFRTPSTAVITLGVWGSLLTLSGTFSQIISYVVFGSWFFYALTTLSVIVLRRKMPDAPRPYKAWGYPYLTLAFVGIAGWFLYNTLIRDTQNVVIGIVLLLLSLPFYFTWTHKPRNQ